MREAPASTEFSCLTLLVGTGTRHRMQIKKGRNTISRTFEGGLIIESQDSKVLDPQEYSQKLPTPLAVIGWYYSSGVSSSCQASIFVSNLPNF